MIRWPKENNASLLPIPLESPTSVAEALQHLAWFEAMATEIAALRSTNTWQLVPPSPS